MGQGKFGFGLVASENISSNGSVTKEVFVSRVVNLDSIPCNESSQVKRSMRENRWYFKCIGEWVIRSITRTHPESLGKNSEIANLSQVEVIPDAPKVNGERFNRELEEFDNRKVSVFMNRNMAEKRRSKILANSLNSGDGKVIVVD
jgi:hypothetical protein